MGVSSQIGGSQYASPQASSPQASSPHASSPHASLDCATDAHEASLNTGTGPPCGSGTRNWLRPRFGFGGEVSAAAAAMSISPMPPELTLAAGMSALAR